MPLLESSEATKFTYETMLQWWSQISSQDMVKIDEALEQISLQYDVSKGEALVNILNNQGFEINQAADGTWRGSFYANPANMNIPNNPINSNSSTISRGTFRQWYANKPEFNASTGMTFLKPTRFPVSGGLGAQAVYTVGSVLGAVGAASTGITLGKTIAPLLYQANPNFWDSVGINQGSFNPETWASLTNDSDSPFAGLFNLILGLDPATGKTQAYMDENAFAYMAMALSQNGFFTQPPTELDSFEEGTTEVSGLEFPVYSSPNPAYLRDDTYNRASFYGANTTDTLIICVKNRTNDLCAFLFASKTPFNYGSAVVWSWPPNRVPTITYNAQADRTTYNNQTFYWGKASGVYIRNQSDIGNCYVCNCDVSINSSSQERAAISLCYNMLFNGTSESIEGVSNQEGATLPNDSDWTDIPSTLNSLQNQYPDLWNDPLVWDNVQPDGTNPQLRYIPVSMPDATSAIDNQPVSGNQTQAQTQIGTGISTDTLLQLITDLMTQTQPDTATQPIQQNPVDTGTGTTPTPLPPVGSASALWSVYHPTQAQVNSFGAWLWTGDIITQIQQLLQNPMEGIITLHKVFASPVDSGSGTIVVGRLDSNVPSATVTQQYVTVDCGSIDCYEEFGNVFDYSPYTDVALYLPFIGIVPLNVSDIMRSSIHVTYGVDVFTGACLAMVEVTRDGNTINLYQYAGMASVEYPLTGSVHSGLITGLLGVAGSIAATVATGGVGAPAAIAAVGGLASAGTSHNARAGGFSGNAGAMGIKTPYLIIERPQTKVAVTFPELAGYPTNYSCKLNECSGHVVVKHVHIEGINATDSELDKINNLLMSGVIV